MTKKIKLSELSETLKDVQILSIEGVTIEGDTEFDLDGLGGGFNPMLAGALGQEFAILAQQLSRFSGMFSAGKGSP
ncbi:MAG: hypothetical protein QM426_06270 [Euryarchaeota archaeon]|nr:hypothetical protein [Euryarchaeota archaeon]